MYFFSKIINCLLSLQPLFPHKRGDCHSCYNLKNRFRLHNRQSFSFRIMVRFKNRMNLAAVSRETPDNTRNSQSQNTLEPGTAQEYISQVSEEVGGRVTKKLSKDFCRTESRILCALSKLDEFLLNPQVRTCSVAVPGASRNNDSENREPTGNRSPGNSCPDSVFSACHSNILNDSEQGETHHLMTGVQEKTPYCFPWISSLKGTRSREVSNSLAVRTSLRQLKQIRLC